MGCDFYYNPPPGTVSDREKAKRLRLKVKSLRIEVERLRKTMRKAIDAVERVEHGLKDDDVLQGIAGRNAAKWGIGLSGALSTLIDYRDELLSILEHEDTP